MRRGKPWTQEEIKQLRELVKTHTYEQMAGVLGHTPDSCRAKARSLKLRKYILHRANHHQDVVIHTYAKRYGVKRAAKHFKISRDSVKNAGKRIRARQAEIRQRFDGVRFDHFRAGCAKEARDRGVGHLAEDFIGWAIVKVLEGRQTSIKNLCLDFIREEVYNDKLDKDSRQVQNAIYNAVPVVEEREEDEPGHTPAAATSKPRSDAIFRLADKLKLKKRDRLVFLLYWREDLSQEEIGLYLGVTMSRVCQLLSRITKALVKNAQAKAMLAE